MNALQLELSRLYSVAPKTPVQSSTFLLNDASSRVRAMVIEVTGPASWEALSAVWRGAQAELDLPAPAIAVNGVDAIALWFSLDSPVVAQEALRFIDGLRRRYLGELAPSRVRLFPHGTSNLPASAHVIPALNGSTGNWSAFVAPDLAPIFEETPWLDVEPNEEGQTQLLRGLRSISSAVFSAAWTTLAPLTSSPSGRPSSPSTEARSADVQAEAIAFLLRVMQDQGLDMTHRLEAARTLLQHAPSKG